MEEWKGGVVKGFRDEGMGIYKKETKKIFRGRVGKSGRHERKDKGEMELKSKGGREGNVEVRGVDKRRQRYSHSEKDEMLKEGSRKR